METVIEKINCQKNKDKLIQKPIYLSVLLGVAEMRPLVGEVGVEVPWFDVAALVVDGRDHFPEKSWCRLLNARGLSQPS